MTKSWLSLTKTGTTPITSAMVMVIAYTITATTTTTLKITSASPLMSHTGANMITVKSLSAMMIMCAPPKSTTSLSSTMMS